MKGRPAGEAIAALAATPAEALPRALAEAGYAAVLVDRAGYEPVEEAALRRALRLQLGPPALTNGNGRFLLYPLPAAAAEP